LHTNIEKYKVEGKVFIWKFLENTRNYPGWNLTMDTKCAESLEKLFNLMEESEYPSKKTLEIFSPTQKQLIVPNDRGGHASWKTKEQLILNFNKFGYENLWKLIESKNILELSFGKNKIYELKNAITGITKGEGDYGICDDSGENILYFWWNIK